MGVTLWALHAKAVKVWRYINRIGFTNLLMCVYVPWFLVYIAGGGGYGWISLANAIIWMPILWAGCDLAFIRGRLDGLRQAVEIITTPEVIVDNQYRGATLEESA